MFWFVEWKRVTITSWTCPLGAEGIVYLCSWITVEGEHYSWVFCFFFFKFKEWDSQGNLGVKSRYLRPPLNWRPSERIRLPDLKIFRTGHVRLCNASIAHISAWYSPYQARCHNGHIGLRIIVPQCHFVGMRLSLYHHNKYIKYLKAF